jgi:uncharacterized protein YjbJ (UPF0337 family)
MANKWAEISGEWKRFAIEAKKKWSELSDEELLEVKGNRNNLASMVQRQYFVSRKEAHSQIEAWVNDLKL